MQQLAQMYTAGTEMIPLTVCAEALPEAGNLAAGSTTDLYPSDDYVYACPKSKGSLNVSLLTNKVNAREGKSGEEFLKEQFKKANIGKEQFGIEDLEVWGVFYDKAFTRPVEGDMLTTAGTCYIAVSLNPELQKQYTNYTVKALSVSVM